MVDYDVCVVGSANLDLVASTIRIPSPGETVLGHDFAEHPGGKGLNQAVAASRSGARVAFVGCVGDDAAGAVLRSVLDHEAIASSSLRTVGEPTGRALIVVDDSGENSIVVVPGANHALEVSTTLPASSVVLCQLEVPMAAVQAALAAGRAAGATTILNPAPAGELPDGLLALCDIVAPNQHEVALLGGVDHLLQEGCRAVIVTLGAAGADIHTSDGVTHSPPFAVDALDSTGAGDAFCGALSARIAAGDDLADAVRWATAAGALATTVRGAVPAQPGAAAIRRLLSARR